MEKRITLVIGSGGIKCAAAIGLWQALQEAEIPVGEVVGCSGGSIYGALIANGTSADDMAAWSERLWTRHVMQGYIENLKASKDGSLRFNERSGLVDDTVMNANLEAVFGDLAFDDLGIPLKIVATDLLSGEKVILSQGRVFEAIRASIAIPIIFPPWEVDGRLLIDGAASDPLPVDVAIQDGADVIIAMGFPLDYRSRFRSMTAVQEQLNNIYINNILNATFAFHNLAHHADIFPVIPEFDGTLSMFDVEKIPLAIARGKEAAQEHLPYIRRALAA
ncbi:MAG TPA: patatin-like phospholipase family protein [Anaerolineales bacterium]|nr:patatin-like phospholipase family protein [Anaerolineales bacterium]